MEEFLKSGTELLKLGMVALIAGLGAYFGTYLKTKAQNWATHEDVNKVLDQVSKVTTTTKEIEAKISGDVWDRQKRWELKRDVLFEAAKRLVEVENSLLSLDSVLQVERANPKQKEQSVWLEEKSERIIHWRKTSNAFDETRLLVRIVCGQKAQEAFDAFGSFAEVIAGAMIKANDEIYHQSQAELMQKSFAVKNAIRKELGIDVPN